MKFSTAIKALPVKMSSLFRVVFALVLMLGFIPYSLAANRLMNVKYQSVADHQLELQLVFEKKVSAPDIHTNTSPNQISLKFSDSLSGLKDNRKFIDNRMFIDSADVKSVSVHQDNKQLQVLLNLDKVKEYQGRVGGNTYFLTVSDKAFAKVSQPVVTQPTNTAANNFDGTLKANDGTSKLFANSIEKIDFHRAENGGGDLLIKLKNSTVAANVARVGGKLQVKLYNTSIAPKMLYVMDVKDFATPVKSYETFQGRSATKLLVKVSGNFGYSYKQDGNLFKINIKKTVPKSRASGPRKKKKYTGKTLSLNFQNIPVRSALKIIADYKNFNLVTSDSVSGNVTLRLDNVPWDQALDLILRAKGLGKRIEGNILMVAPAKELAIRKNKRLAALEKSKALAPLYTEYMQVNYAKAADIAKLLERNNNVSTTSNSGLLSDRGTVSVDDRTNTLLVKDTQEILENVRRLIKVVDIPVRQVLIESRMVTVKDDVAQNLGIKWGITTGLTNSDHGITGGVSGTLAGAEGLANADVSDRLNVNMPSGGATPTSIAFQVAKLADGTLLDLELSALEQEQQGEIIASPRITTSNQKSAYIEQGVEIPYVESASSGAATVSFKKAVLSLKVTPQITPDNKVILDLEITQDSQGKTVATPLGEAVSIDTQRIGTQVLVAQGETIVLGGIFQQQKIHTVSKVPLLGDIPYLGYLFRNTSDSNQRQELLIFVTPKIISQKLQ